jgi:hypothetical protein
MLTAYERSGEKVFEESFEAPNDTDAKQIGEQILLEKGYQDYTHRLTSSNGKLVLFHR